MLRPFFANMQDMQSLVLPTKVQSILLSALERSIQEEREQGGYILVKNLRRDNAYMATGVLQLPDLYTGINEVYFNLSQGSPWELLQIPRALFTGDIGLRWRTNQQPNLDPYSKETWRVQEDNLGHLLLEKHSDKAPIIHGYIQNNDRNTPLNIIPYNGDTRHTNGLLKSAPKTRIR